MTIPCRVCGGRHFEGFVVGPGNEPTPDLGDHIADEEEEEEEEQNMIRDAILRVWNAAAYTADVQLTGSLPTYITGVPVARNIDGTEMTAGRRVAIAFFADANDPTNAVLFAVYV